MTCCNNLIFLKNKDRLTSIKKEQKKDTKNLKKTIKGKPKIKTTTTKWIENASDEGLNFFLFIPNFHSRMQKIIK